MQEKFIRLNKNDIHHVQDSLLYQNQLLHIPIINQYALRLREIFKQSHPYIPSWPKGKKYALMLSHDCDYPEMIRGIEILRYLLRNRSKSDFFTIHNIVTGKETFWKFDEWTDLESRFKTKSAFYFCGLHGNLIRYFIKAPDPLYDASSSKFINLMQSLTNKGFEVGMHASYLAYHSPNQFRKEKDVIEQSAKNPVVGNRHHYWHMNPHHPYETAQRHHEIGLLYDSSISFECHSGFRYSVCSPFHLYHPELQNPVPTLQLPPSLMDDHLFGHAKLSRFNNYEDHIDSVLQAVKTHEGVFVADYHVRVLNDTFYPQWGNSYRYLLEKISLNQDFYCDTPKAIAQFWLDREQKILETSSYENCCIN